MAKRYGGKYSPHPTGPNRTEPYQQARPDPVGSRANTLFFPGIVLGATSLNDGAVGLGIGLTGAAALILGAWLLREGLRAETAFDARKTARRPAFPRKIAAAVFTGIGAALAVFKQDPSLMAPAIYGAAATALHLAAFGIDPMQDKGMGDVDDLQRDRVARAIDEGERHLDAMADAIQRAGDRDLAARVAEFSLTARRLFRRVEEDPGDLSGARKYMTLYLSGARDATEKFADLYQRRPDGQARADYAALLDDLEQNYAARSERLFDNDRTDLNVEIDVLRDRLARSGARPPLTEKE
ncbi:MAG: 5-bromo-4-chloroindolyl phosphate hydrolysis family protein [Marinibacterium sp.]|nr:5-bromo-4-chloroindolyl phosphate hydrolysis family protein [Marinibacterium sp.]